MSKNKSPWFIVVVLVAFASACGGAKRSSELADHLDQVLTDTLGSAQPGSIARTFVTRGTRTAYDKGVKIKTEYIWNCDGDTPEDVAKCQRVGAGDPHCKSTTTGTACID
jgi:hypothetical protein